ncbi:MAG TPA: DUF2255 family protein [Acidimicrobiales bacterium]|nr:DUF2255 family protein [Acidimicrobiales bacterium]
MTAAAPATAWTAEQLERIGRAEELQLASRGPDRTLRPYTTMWVVRVDDDLYVRSAGGPDRPWYRQATASGSGRIRAGGVEVDVAFGHGGEFEEAIDAAYHLKYDRYGPGIVGSVGGETAHQVTVRLIPAPAPAPQEISHG